MLQDGILIRDICICPKAIKVLLEICTYKQDKDKDAQMHPTLFVHHRTPPHLAHPPTETLPVTISSTTTALSQANWQWLLIQRMHTPMLALIPLQGLQLLHHLLKVFWAILRQALTHILLLRSPMIHPKHHQPPDPLFIPILTHV